MLTSVFYKLNWVSNVFSTSCWIVRERRLLGETRCVGCSLESPQQTGQDFRKCSSLSACSSGFLCAAVWWKKKLAVSFFLCASCMNINVNVEMYNLINNYSYINLIPASHFWGSSDLFVLCDNKLYVTVYFSFRRKDIKYFSPAIRVFLSRRVFSSLKSRDRGCHSLGRL